MGSEDDDKKHMENHQHEFAHDNHDDWETQPPYMRPDEATEKRENFEKKVHGSCHCGRVEYWLNSDKPLASKYCHCIDCKKIHGKIHFIDLRSNSTSVNTDRQANRSQVLLSNGLLFSRKPTLVCFYLSRYAS